MRHSSPGQLQGRLEQLRERLDTLSASRNGATSKGRHELDNIAQIFASLERELRDRGGKVKSTSAPSASPDQSATVRAARSLNRASGVLSASVLMDSAIEHYRGSFKNKAMFTPLITSALTLLVSLHGTADKRPAAHLARDVTYGLAAITGLVGTGFHFLQCR